MARVLLRFVALFAGFATSAGLAQTAGVAVTDLMTPEEVRQSGLAKLSKDELKNLNSALLRIVSQLAIPAVNSRSFTPSRDEQDLFDARAKAVAYISDDDQTIYL